MASQLAVFKSWPTAPFTDSLVKKSLASLSCQTTLVQSPVLQNKGHQLLQWSTYDDIDHELTFLHAEDVLSSSYVIRKALTRKHFLARTIHSYTTKNSQSVLRAAAPQSFEIEISFADELDEMLTDELWELGHAFESESQKWWILKPGMADRGNGIRLFNSREALEEIFEEFEESDDGGESGPGEEEEQDGTAVVTSQLRHFVIQEYLPNPLLLDPREVSIQGFDVPSSLEGRKFHLRAYCVASGALEVYLCEHILALFSATPYAPPTPAKVGKTMELSSHLTNTSLQTEHGEENVRLLDELVGCHVCNEGIENSASLTKDDIKEIIRQITEILGESFKAALQNPVHFQMLPNAFELFGVDFLVTFTPTDAAPELQVYLLEFNSEPAIELTGPRLAWILEDLFKAIGQVCIDPFFSATPREETWSIGESRHGLIKCLEENVHSRS